MAYIHPYVYAIGGRAYGSKAESILKACERFNFNTESWERIKDMQYRSCTATACVVNN